MTVSPFVSVGLFVYNGEPFVESAIRSVLDQTFTDFELIVSDNASTDHTGEIAQAYARRDGRIRYYRNEKNMGAGWNSRRVCELATGKYFRWATADDMLEPDLLRRCVEILESDPSCVLAYPKAKIIDENDRFIEFYVPPVKFDSSDPAIRLREVLKAHICLEIFGVIRMSVLRQVPPMGSFTAADQLLLAQLAIRGRFVECPEHLYIGRRHRGQSVYIAPERSKRRGFRLTRRVTTLPPPEWWDPAQERSLTFGEFRQMRELAALIHNAPLSMAQKLRCYSLLPPWIKKHFRRLVKDLVLAADTILYNLQVPKTVATGGQSEATANRKGPGD